MFGRPASEPESRLEKWDRLLKQYHSELKLNPQHAPHEYRRALEIAGQLMDDGTHSAANWLEAESLCNQTKISIECEMAEGMGALMILTCGAPEVVIYSIATVYRN